MMDEKMPVRLAREVILCPVIDGIAQVPVGVGVDVELTTIIEGVLRRAGLPEEAIATAMDEIRVEYVMGPAVSVTQVRQALDQQVTLAVRGGEKQ